MSITARLVIFTAAGAAVLATPSAALAQEDANAALSAMRECAKIDDPAARFACYDNNFRDTDADTTVLEPRQSESPQPSSVPVVRNGEPSSGLVSARPPHRPAAQNSASARAPSSVAAVAEKAPGTYLLTLDDGAQWEFAQSMGVSYDAPRRGSAVQILPGALGGHRIRVDGQQPVRVRRVR